MRSAGKRWRQWRTKFDPMKPAPPVTRRLFMLGSPSGDLAHGRGARLEQAEQVFAVTALAQRKGDALELHVRDEALPPGDLLGAADAQALPLLDHLHVGRGLVQR